MPTSLFNETAASIQPPTHGNRLSSETHTFCCHQSSVCCCSEQQHERGPEPAGEWMELFDCCLNSQALLPSMMWCRCCVLSLQLTHTDTRLTIAVSTTIPSSLGPSLGCHSVCVNHSTHPCFLLSRLCPAGRTGHQKPRQQTARPA